MLLLLLLLLAIDSMLQLRLQAQVLRGIPFEVCQYLVTSPSRNLTGRPYAKRP